MYARDGRLMALFGETRRYPVDDRGGPAARRSRPSSRSRTRASTSTTASTTRASARAVWLLATTDDKRVPGGSTITQQVARQFFLSSEYSYTRKLAEMLLAMRWRAS